MEVKDKKKEALARKNISKISRRKVAVKQTVTKKSRRNNQTRKKTDKDKIWRVEKITNHKCGRSNNKVTGLLIKWVGDPQSTWGKRNLINETASGTVKDYIKTKNMKK